MKYTDTLKLSLFEATDNANLLDVFNGDMQLIDTAFLQMLQRLAVIEDVAKNANEVAVTTQTQLVATNLALSKLTVRVAALEEQMQATGTKVQGNTTNISGLTARVTALEGK